MTTNSSPTTTPTTITPTPPKRKKTAMGAADKKFIQGCRFAKCELRRYEDVRRRTITNCVQMTKYNLCDPVHGAALSSEQNETAELARLLVANALFPHWRGETVYRTIHAEPWDDGDYVIVISGVPTSRVLSHEAARRIVMAIREE